MERVAKHFGSTIAVDDLDLTVQRGEFFSLLGSSGCGKTTTLQMIAGFEEPTSGRVLLHGHDVTSVPPYRRDVNTIFQSYALFPHLNVFDNIAFGLRRRKLPDSEIRGRVALELELVGLDGFERRRTTELSGGQQQRVALARALVNRPTVLLLDEPLGALDLQLRRRMQTELKRIQREVGITFLYVTHDQDEALALSDRIAVIDRGQLCQEGTPSDLYERPASVFVARFLGSSSLLRAHPSADGESATLSDGARIEMPPLRSGETRDASVLVGLRPERVRLGAAAEGMTNVLQCSVLSVAYLGTHRQVIVSGPEQTEIIAHVPNTAAGAVPEAGHTVTVGWDASDAFVVGDDLPPTPRSELEETFGTGVTELPAPKDMKTCPQP